MLVTVFGATGGIGRHVVGEALRAGHAVRGVTRNRPGTDPAHERVAWVQGDLADTASIRGAVEGCDAVIWAVGATSNTRDQVGLFEAATRELVSAMEQFGVRRLVALSGAGITLDEERKPLGGRLMSALVDVLARYVVEAKEVEYDLIKRSSLDWVLVRPPRVVPGETTGSYVAGDTLAGRGVTQGDLAHFMVAQLIDDTYLRRAPYVATVRRSRGRHATNPVVSAESTTSKTSAPSA